MQRVDTKEYFKLLCPDYPEWLDEYINTPRMQKQDDISVSSGMIYTNLFVSKVFYSSLEHSIGVALIIWHFTHSKKQTLAGLFHDIATPVFKHCVDVMNGDALKQESTENLTTEMIKNSAEIMALLKRDGIKLEEVDNYHLYPIADNDTPQLAADRLEYSLSNPLFIFNQATFDEIKEFYNDIEIQKNEFGVDELGFKTKTIARKFAILSNKMSVMYRNDRRRFTMRVLADILKRMKDDGLITVEQLYEMKEIEIVELIKKSKYKDIFEILQNAKTIHVSKTAPKDVYYVHEKHKIRYVDPLYNGQRMSKVCKLVKNAIDKNLAYDMDNYLYLDFKF